MALNQIVRLRSFVPWQPSQNHTIMQTVRSLCGPNVRVEVVRDRSVSNRSAVVSHNRVWDPLLDPAWVGHGPTCSFQIGGCVREPLRDPAYTGKRPTLRAGFRAT